MFDKQYNVIKVWSCDSQLPPIVNKFIVCMNSVSHFDEQMFLPIWIDEIGRNQDKSINQTSVSSISTDWPIQSISIKIIRFTDFHRFIDWQINTDFYRLTTPGLTLPSRCKNSNSVFLGQTNYRDKLGWDY